MKYRKFGSLGWDVSALGFGAMRFPLDSRGKIEEEESIKMIRYAIDHGVNYIDTAFPYHGGKSETIVGKALQEGYREKVHLVTKLPLWLMKKESDFDKFLKRQVKRLQSNPDIYLFHGMNQHRFELVKKLGLIKKMEVARDNGSFKHIGFSFHDTLAVFKEILDYYPWDCCQIQFNYMDIEYQAGLEGLKYAGKKNIALIVMEPIRGGKLALTSEQLDEKTEMKEILEKSKVKRTMADWALQYVWDQPEVSVVLSGMSTMQQVVENVESANNSRSNSLTEGELTTINELRDAYRKYDIISCTSCKYCLPCPNDVTIPTVFSFVNELAYWGEKRSKIIKSFYGRLAKTSEEFERRKGIEGEVEGGAYLCTECGECVEKCPQQIDIPEMMKKAKAVLDNGQEISDVFN